MNPITFLAVGRAVAYKINSLTERYLQERGASPLTTFALHRYTIIPAIIWTLLFIRPHDIAKILHTPHQVVYFLIIFLIWNGQQFIHSYRINATSTVSVITTLNNVITLPLLLIAGTYFNHDKPNAFSVAGIAVLVFAMLVKPAHHISNKRVRLSQPLSGLIVFMLGEALVDVVLLALSRQLLKEIPPRVFIGVFDVIVLVACIITVAFLSRRMSLDVKTVVKHYPVRALTLPLIFFGGSVVEFYASADLPIYVLVSIACITFVMDIYSDLTRHRIRFNLQTAAFIGLVFIGIGLAVYST